MLTDLQIRNFAIIDSLHVSFGGGLNILTGETGAGKSIIVDAVNLILGGRASTDMIRSGEEEAVVEALFALPDASPVYTVMEESGIPCDGEMLVKRTVSVSGRNRIFINGTLATGALLSRIVPELVNIYGQHESQTLLRSGSHLDLLDSFASPRELRTAYAAAFAEYRLAAQELRHLEEGEREAARSIDLLSFQSREIGEAALRPGEEAELEQERRLLSHAEKLGQGVETVYQTLYAADAAVVSLLAEAEKALAEAARIDERLQPLALRLNSAAVEIEDVAAEVWGYAERVECDPSRLDRVEARLETLRRLKRKYGDTVEEILTLKETVDRQLEALLGRETRRSELEQRRSELEQAVRRLGTELSAARRKGAAELKKAVERELHLLAMPHALFEAVLQPLPEPGPAGLERVEFHFAPNPGEGLKPLSRIASGGELSRLMLAFKQVHPESDVPTLVFDEVDSGIGGSVAALVGRKLQNVARRQQVLCITHMPQVAAFADLHYRVEKRVENGRTCTMVRDLDHEGRVGETARMLAGVAVTVKTLEHAAEMIEEAKKSGAESL